LLGFGSGNEAGGRGNCWGYTDADSDECTDDSSESRCDLIARGRVHFEFLLVRRCYATSDATGPTAGAMLMPTVMKAQTTAAKTETIWLREVRVIPISFVNRRTIPAMPELLHRVCQFEITGYKQIDMVILSIQT
jgi:hypothetical protein